MAVLPILTYHSIDRSGSILSTSPELFHAQMAYLAARRCQTLTVSEAVSHLRGEGKCSHSAVALTFDDGFRTVFDVALPVMREYGFRATVFIVSGCCGKENSWDRGRPFPMLPLMDVQEIRTLASAGWEIGAHSVTHARLTHLEEDALEREMNECRMFLQETAGVRVRCLAYPYGAHDRHVRSRVRALFESACGTEPGYARSSSDLFALPRVDMYYLRPAWLFRALETGRLAGYLLLRRWLSKAHVHRAGN